jgi:hypothetical protein
MDGAVTDRKNCPFHWTFGNQSNNKVKTHMQECMALYYSVLGYGKIERHWWRDFGRIFCFHLPGKYSSLFPENTISIYYNYFYTYFEIGLKRASFI